MYPVKYQDSDYFLLRTREELLFYLSDDQALNHIWSLKLESIMAQHPHISRSKVTDVNFEALYVGEQKGYIDSLEMAICLTYENKEGKFLDVITVSPFTLALYPTLHWNYNVLSLQPNSNPLNSFKASNLWLSWNLHHLLHL